MTLGIKDEHTEFLKEMNVHIIDVLGSGGQGTCYLVKKNNGCNVLKITDSKDEALLSAYISQDDHKGLFPCVNSVYVSENNDYYGILRENINDIFTEHNDEDGLGELSARLLWTMILNKIDGHNNIDFYNGKTNNKLKHQLGNLYDEFIVLYEKLIATKNTGLDVTIDLVFSNLGKKQDGSLCVRDYGIYEVNDNKNFLSYEKLIIKNEIYVPKMMI